MPSIANKLFITAALAVLGASMSGAHACGMLSDPNSPECKNGTGPVRAGANLPSAQQAAPAARPTADAPGRGQQGCAFFDTRTNRCLTVRPNTKAYDDAVQTGVEAAMMGIQIQQDALRRAAEMGVIPGFTTQPLQQPGSKTQAETGIGQAADSSNSGDTFTRCLQSTLSKIETKNKRSATTGDINSAMAACEK